MTRKRNLTNKQKNSRLTILNVICMIITIILVCIFSAQVSLRFAYTSKSCDEAIQNINYSEIMVQNDDEEMSLVSYINKYFVPYDVPDSTIEELLNNSTAPDFITEKYHELTDYLSGKTYSLPVVTEDEIVNLIDDNRDMIYQSSEIRFVSENHHELKALLKNPLASFNASLETSNTISFLRHFTSILMIVAAAVALLVILLIWCSVYSAFTERTYPAIKNFSIAMTAAAGIFMIVSFIIYNSPSMLKIDLGFIDTSDIIRNLSLYCTFTALLPLILGIVLIALSTLTGLKNNKNFDTEPVVSKKKISTEQDSSTNTENIEKEAKKTPEQEEKEKKKLENDMLINSIKEKNADKKAENKPEQTDTISKVATENKEVKEDAANIETPQEKVEKTLENKIEKIEETADKVETENKVSEEVEQKTELVMPEINSDASVPVNGRTCPKCGKVNLSRNLFCSECGELLK